MAFKDHVLTWIQREIDPAATEVLNVDGDGTDWEGDTEGGFYSRFSVELKYATAEGKTHTRTIGGDQMDDLWTWVVQGWPTN